MTRLQTQIVDAFYFDEKRNAIVPSQQFAALSPTAYQRRVKLIKGGLLHSDGITLNELAELMRPVAIPKVDLTAHKTTETPVPIVMSPVPGHYKTAYDLTNPHNLVQHLSNQHTAANWQMIKLALEGLGATVTVSKSIYGDKVQPPHFIRPAEEMFARDCGFVFGNTFWATSTTATADLVQGAIPESLRGLDPLADFFIDDISNVSGDLKKKHAQNVHSAFRAAGCELAYADKGLFLEGGDIQVDIRKGIVFIGHDPRTQNHTRLLNTQNFCRLIKDETGADVIPLARWETQLLTPEDKKENYYHLDTFMSVLPKGDLLFDARPALKETIVALQRIYGNEIIYVGNDNPQRVAGSVVGTIPNYTTNLVAIGRTLLMPSCGDKLHNDLKKRGYVVVTAETLGAQPSDLYLRGGGPHCLTQTAPCQCD